MNPIRIDRALLTSMWHGISAEDAEAACLRTEEAACPRVVSAEFNCADLGALWQGEDIRRHLSGCEKCVWICLTLGGQVDRMLRAAGVSDMWQCTLLDAAASCLIEQCADEAEEELRAAYHGRGLFLTKRFSPGYGDFPISVQPEVLRLTNAEKRIGLTVTESCILVPRKSITAVCGVSSVPAEGALAGCEHCALRETCQRRKEGNPCGRQNPDP